MPKPIANWEPDLDCWVTCDDETESLFSVPSAVFSETFPTSGMTVAGTAYPPPASEQPTSAPESLSLLPTPTGDDAGNLTRDSGTFQYLTRAVRQIHTPMASMPEPSHDGSLWSDAEPPCLL